METETTGQRIRQALKTAGITQRELARQVGVSEKSVGNWVADRDPPKGTHLAAMSSLLGVKASWLLTGEQTVDGSEILREISSLRKGQEEILAAVLEVRRLYEGKC
jgi:transcriptional regulator with XRE-family HTH domain